MTEMGAISKSQPRWSACPATQRSVASSYHSLIKMTLEFTLLHSATTELRVREALESQSN